jgi:CheY-like chemotaxis protein
MQATILLVEDDQVLRAVLSELLESGGHSVMPCENGREAVRQLFLAQVDLVITDLSMPEIDGYELIKILTFEWPDVRVIAMSGFADDRARRLTEIYGVRALLQKPFSLDEILRVVESCQLPRGKSHRAGGY